MTLTDLLRLTVQMDGSDLHLCTDTPPQVRVDGHLRRLELPVLTPDVTKSLCYSVLTDAQKKKFEAIFITIPDLIDFERLKSKQSSS